MMKCAVPKCKHDARKHNKTKNDISFHRLFYLMVLINGYTISKSDVDDYTPDSLVDSLREPEPGREPRARHESRGGRGPGEPAATLAANTTKLTTLTTRLKDSFWKRFRHRNKTTKRKDHRDGIKTDGLRNNNFGKKRHNDRNQKREVSTKSAFQKGFFKSTKDFFANTKNNQLKFFNMTSVDSTTGLNNITSDSTSSTTLKSTQSETTAATLSTSQSILDDKKSSTDLETSAGTSSADWAGTAQLEALLESIKARAMHLLIESNPNLTSIITNSVNEVTFEADPLLHHIDQTTPHPKATAILKTSTIHKLATEPTNVTPHNILRRSPIDAISTMANSVEEALQKELKKVYKKLKCKVSCHKVINAETTTHHKTKHTETTTPGTTSAHTTRMKTTTNEKISERKEHHRVAKATRFGKKKKVTSTSTTADANPLSSIDDNRLLGLLEQMLLKSSEYNVLGMMSTCYTPRPKIEGLSKRNVETLADLKLKEQLEGYDHGEMMPDALDDVDMGAAGTSSELPELDPATVTTEEISFKGISDKISYNDYVNGYKYYLKYQQEQEQDDEKFSPLIRYQAHKHHNVDDIGKYILRKLPQIRFARNIFDEIDMDDQDVSTKSDDSWFKKHFYMFLDSNTPKKFHTSETVSLKSALTEPSVDSRPPVTMALGKPSEQYARPPLASDGALVDGASVENLDQLALNLESYKAQLSSVTTSSLEKQIIEEGKEEPAQDGFMLKMMSLLLGGKDRRALKKATTMVDYQPESRFRRHMKKDKQKDTHKKTTSQKITLSEVSIPVQKDNFSKLGVVQMIAQPTTVVKIPAKKKSKLKNLLSKFHLGKKENSNKKAKRHAIRKKFVPFKKIKELLLGPQHEIQGTASHKVENEFDIMTSEIDTFKAVKFSRVPNIAEMRKEIPDINDYLDAPDEELKTKSAARTRPSVEFDSKSSSEGVDHDSPDVPMEFLSDKSRMEPGVTKKMSMKELEHYLADYKESMIGTTKQINDFATKPLETEEKAIAQTRKTLEEEASHELENLKNQNDIKEDEFREDGLAEIGGPLEVNDSADKGTPSKKTIDDVREEIEKLKNKLNMYEPLEKHTGENLRPVSGGISTVTKVMFVPDRIQKLVNKCTERNKKNNTPKASDLQNSKPKREIDFESSIESPNLYEASNEANYRSSDKFSMPNYLSLHATNGNKPKKTLSQYSVSPDHFGELLLWHSDILDVDLVTTTSYAWVVNDDRLAEYTTPNAALLASEVQDMKRFLINLAPVDYVKKRSSTYKTTANFPLGDKKVVLGQPKYFSFSKDENLDNISEPNKAENSIPRAAKKPKNDASAQPILKQVSTLANWTNLSPRPNVFYHTSRKASRMWRKIMVDPLLLTTNFLSAIKSVTPTSKTNQTPKQYFSTPLPMDSKDFEHFLKKSHLDVESVTAPISNIENNISFEKFRATPMIKHFELPAVKTISNSDNLTANNELRLKSQKENLMNDLTQLKLSAKNLSQIADDSYFIFSDDARFMRHRSASERVTDANTAQANKVIKRRKILGKKASLLQGLNLSEKTDPWMSNKENVDYEPEDLSKYILKMPQSVTGEMTKLNKLLYFYTPGKMRNATTSTPASAVAVQLPELTTPIPKLTRNLGLKHKGHPKRVRISYQYDVLYENRPKTLKARSRGPTNAAANGENVVHDSESVYVPKVSRAGEIATRRMRPEANSTLATLLANFTKNVHFVINDMPSQYKPRLSKNKVKPYIRKSKRSANASITEKPVLSKRNASPVTFTAHNVAAFEIYLDLPRSTQPGNMAPGPDINALQVHIALPNDQQSLTKRQLNPSNPVFSAKMSDAVNLEYQVPASEEKLATESHSLSPGLYMLVDNLCKSGHVTLKPILSDLSVLRPRQAGSVKLTTVSTSTKCATTNNLDVLKKVTLNKDFIAAVNKHLVQLYENFSSLNSAEKNVKKSVTISNVKKNDVTNRIRRNIWPALKEMLGGERTCSCHFKENHTLCPTCIATDAVVEEIIFEFNNLANFMKEHCTEIQTFFWMNPNGGKKLTDSVHRLDRMLHDYYKRVKGKCQGKSCQALASHLDKRTVRHRRRILKEVGLIPEDVHAIANDIANILKHRLPFSKDLKENGDKFMNVVDICLPGVRYKKSVTNSYHLYDKMSLNDSKLKNDKTPRHKHVKQLWFGKKRYNYKREATQIEKPFISDSGDTFWSDYINKRSTESQSIDQLPLMTETTLNALTHNINELFLLFNNLNLTDVDPLTKLDQKHKAQDEKKNKKNKKKKNKPKKLKKKHKSIHRLNKKMKEKKPKEYANTSTEVINIDALMSKATETSPTTRALQVVLSNVQQHPSLYTLRVKLEDAVAASTHATETSPTLTQLVLTAEARNRTEMLSTGETVILEEGCGVKTNFLDKLKHFFNGISSNSSNSKTYTPTYNNAIGKRSARAPTVGTEKATLTGNVSILAPTSTFSVVTTSAGDTVQGFPSNDNLRIADTTSLHSESTCSKQEPEWPPTEEPKCPTPVKIEDQPSKDNEPTCPNKETVEYTGLSPTNTEDTTPLIEYETPNGDFEVVITEPTEQTFPTIIIIDEASTESATDEVTIDIMPSNPNEDAKDLLLSVLTYEKEKLDEEFQNIRGSRQVTEAKEDDEKNFKQGLLGSKSTTKSHQPSSFATGNYSLLLDLMNVGKMLRKGLKKNSTKSSTKSSTKDTTLIYDAYNMRRSWVNETDNKVNLKVTSTTGKPTTAAELTTKVIATRHAQTTTKAEKPSTPPATTNAIKADHKKASDECPAPPAPPARVCDVSATVERVREMQRRMSARAFETYVRHLACFKFRETPDYFVVSGSKFRNCPRSPKSKDQDRGGHHLKLKWDWIRNQRQVDAEDRFISNKPEDTKDKIEEGAVDDMLVNFVVDDDFEKFYKGEHGIYKMANSKRKRRKADATNLTRELTDLPAMHPTPNEILAMSGDPITLHCALSSPGAPDRALRWTSAPEALLRRPNVKMDGDTVYIDGARESNAGSYVCKEQGGSERGRVQVRVLVVPRYQIVSTPMYSMQGDACGYSDLRAIRSLGQAMSELVCPRRHCSVTVHEPDCLKDRSDGSALLRATTSLEVDEPDVRCSAGCRRDLAAQLAKMAVADIPTLVNIKVSIAGNKNKTLAPISSRDGTFAVTRRLKRKGLTRKQKHYHPLPPGSVDVAVSCPRRYQLLPAYKICVADPPNTGSEAKRCEQAGQRPRRYEWWWYPPCGYAAAVVAVAVACAACAACGVASHLLARPAHGKSCWAETSRHPPSPSRVILARLFKRSLSAFRHTDSQETRSFPTKPVPPPLPPIDFD